MENQPKQESRYLLKINDCRKLVDQIRDKIGIVICSRAEKLEAETPTQTQLEAELRYLENKLKDLLGDIVV